MFLPTGETSAGGSRGRRARTINVGEEKGVAPTERERKKKKEKETNPALHTMNHGPFPTKTPALLSDSE